MTKPISIDADGRCTCSCADTCPLGRRGSEDRCTRSELVAARVDYESDKSVPLHARAGCRFLRTQADLKPGDLVRELEVDWMLASPAGRKAALRVDSADHDTDCRCQQCCKRKFDEVRPLFAATPRTA